MFFVLNLPHPLGEVIIGEKKFEDGGRRLVMATAADETGDQITDLRLMLAAMHRKLADLENKQSATIDCTNSEASHSPVPRQRLRRSPRKKTCVHTQPHTLHTRLQINQSINQSMNQSNNQSIN